MSYDPNQWVWSSPIAILLAERKRVIGTIMRINEGISSYQKCIDDERTLLPKFYESARQLDAALDKLGHKDNASPLDPKDPAAPIGGAETTAGGSCTCGATGGEPHFESCSFYEGTDHVVPE